MRGEESLDYNDGPNDPPGPDSPGWDAFTGRYSIEQWGVPADTVTVARKNGWLYINGTRLVIEVASGLFFTSDGETVDFRGKDPAWRNIRLRRIA
jgi:hypothetical protein